MNKRTRGLSRLWQNKYTLAIVILSIIFFFMLVFTIHDWIDEYEVWVVDTDSLYYRLDDGDYARLTELAILRRGQTDETDENILELYAVADYYYNSFYYYGLRGLEDADTSVYQEGMKQAAASVGSLSFAIEEIDAIFEGKFAEAE